MVTNRDQGTQDVIFAVGASKNLQIWVDTKDIRRRKSDSMKVISDKKCL